MAYGFPGAWWARALAGRPGSRGHISIVDRAAGVSASRGTPRVAAAAAGRRYGRGRSRPRGSLRRLSLAILDGKTEWEDRQDPPAGRPITVLTWQPFPWSGR